MSLVPASIRKHKGSVFCDDPQIIEFQNVAFHPGRNHLDNQTGVYSQEGLLLHSAAQYHKFPALIKRQPYWIDPAAFSSYPEYNDMIYAGHIVDQYGHFLIEFMSRVYQFVDDERPILVKCNFAIKDMFYSCKWMPDVLSGFGINPDRITIINRPIRVKKLTMCSPAMSEQMYCYDGFVKSCQRVANKIPKTSTSMLSDSDIIYLSRSKLDGGTVIVKNEQAVDEAMNDLGVKVMFPEKLSFSDQIHLFKDNRIIIGQVGTGFHNSLFTEGARGIALNTKNEVDSNYSIMDNASGANIQYVYSDLVIDIPIDGLNCYFHKEVINPKKLAEDLVRSANILKNNYVVPNMGRFATSSAPFKIQFKTITNSSGEIITVDERTQEVSSISGYHKKLMLIMTITEISRGPLHFMVSEVGSIMNILGDIEPSVIYPVDIDEKSGHIKSYDGSMLRSPPNNHDEELYLNWSNICGEWETFSLKDFNMDLQNHKSDLNDIVNIVAALTFPQQKCNLDYYFRNRPGMVSMIEQQLRYKNLSLSDNFLAV